MRKGKIGRQLGMKSGPRKALMKTLANSFVISGRIKTTEAKAKELSRMVEKEITRAKIKNLQTLRMLSRTFSQEATNKLVDEIAPSFKTRNGGYTRIIKLGARKSEGAEMAIIELVK